jgi:hypothetical protein
VVIPPEELIFALKDAGLRLLRTVRILRPLHQIGDLKTHFPFPFRARHNAQRKGIIMQ